MTTTKKIAHNTGSQLIGKVISTSLGLIAIGMMTRYLGQERFGWYITTITFLQFLAILVDFGLIPVTAQMMSEPNFDKPTLLKNLLGYRFTTAVIFLAFAPLIVLFFPYPPIVKIAISFTTINMLATAMNQVLIGYYQTKLKMHIQAFGEVAGRIVLVGGLWWMIAIHAGFIPVMIIVTAASVTYTLVLWTLARRNTSIGFGFDWTIWKAITKKMWPIAISIVFNVVYLKGDIILLSIFKNQDTVGLYGAAYRVIDILSQTAMMVMGVMLPLLTFHWSRGDKVSFKKRYQQSFDIMMLIGLPIAIGTIVLAKPIMVFVAGSEFIESGNALQILAIAVFAVYIGAIFGHTAVALNKQKNVMWIYISDAVLTLAGYLIFIPLYGMYGAAWMTVFSEVYAGLLLALSVRKYTKEKLDLRRWAKLVFSTIIMAAVLFQLPHWNIFILVLIGGLVYVAFVFLLGAVNIETIKEIIRKEPIQEQMIDV